MAMEYFCCYHSYARKLAKLSDQEVGRLFRALLDYSERGEPPELAGRESVAFDFIADDIDRAKAAYAAKCEQNRINRSSTNDNDRGRTITTVNDRQRPSTDVHKNKDKDKYKSKEKVLEAKASCAEPQGDSAPPVILLPLNDGTEYPVSKEQCHEWAGLYPAVNVIQQLRNMRGWLISNPNRKKTKAGICRFITNWLSRQQNSGGTAQRQPPQSSNVFLEMLREEEGYGP